MTNVRRQELWAAKGSELPRSVLSKSQCNLFEDFIGAAFNTTDGKWATQIVGAGPPTAALVADAQGGEFALTLEATNEVQQAILWSNDQLNINITKNPVLRARVKFATIGTNQFAVIGLASVGNATLDSIATHVWFRLEASMDILVEGDDGTTDTDDQDTGIDAVAATYLELKIDASDLSAVTFSIDNVKQSPTISIPLATGTLQPYIIVGKSTGTGTPSVIVDWIELEWDRNAT